MNKQKYKIGIAVSRFYPNLAASLQEGAEQVLKNSQQSHQLNVEIETKEVPGCAELPLMAHWLFNRGCSAVICLGVVIRGETTHYDSVCRLFEQGIIQVQLKWSRPCLCGVLMTENLKQAQERLSEKNHKGRQVAQSCLDMLYSLSNFK